MIKVVVTGAMGRMGKEVMRAVWHSEDLDLIGAADPKGEGIDAGIIFGRIR